jgi:hypothetical protein
MNTQLKKYRVSYRVTRIEYYIVEAENKEHAKMTGFDEGELDESQGETMDAEDLEVSVERE